MGGGGARLTLSGMTVFSLRKPLRVRPAEGPQPSAGAGAPELASTTLLLPPQGQQLGVEGEDLAHRLLELATALHSLACPLHPRLRNPLHPLAALEHESERPNRVSPAGRAMTGRFTATTVRLGQGTGKALGREVKTGQELAFSPPQARRLTSPRVDRVRRLHLSVIIHSDKRHCKTFIRRFSRILGRVTPGNANTQKGGNKT